MQQVAEQARGLASQLDDREPSELLEDVRRFARRRPGTFLLGALAAGIVVGRLTRGAKAAQDSSSARSPRRSGARGPRRASPGRTRRLTVANPRGQGLSGDRHPEPVSARRVSEMSEAGIRARGGGRHDRSSLHDGPGRRRTAEANTSTTSSTRSLGEIVGDITQDMSTLIRQEMDLADLGDEARGHQARQGRRDVRRCRGRPAT